MDFNEQYFNDLGGTVDETEYAPELGGAKYGYVQWVEAFQQQSMPNGGAFLPVEQPQFIGQTFSGFTPIQIQVAMSQSVWGISLNPITFQVLAQRSDWGVDQLPNERGMVLVGERALADAIVARVGGRARSKTRALVIIKGLENLGLVMLTMSGVKGMALGRELSDFFNRAWRPYADMVNKKIGRPGPVFGLYCTLQAGQQRAASKDPAKSAKITPPEWVQPVDGSIKDILVPMEYVQLAQSLWAEAKEWESAPLFINSRAQGYLNMATGQPQPIMPPAQYPQQPPAQYPQQPPAASPWQRPVAPPPATQPAYGTGQTLPTGGAQPQQAPFQPRRTTGDDAPPWLTDPAF